MSLLVSGADLRSLYGERFTFRPVGGTRGRPIPFTISDEPGTWPRSGLEAYAMQGECEHPDRGQIPSVLKLFKFDVPERKPRTAFLIRHGLAKHHAWLFHGVPYAAIAGLRLQSLNLVGHV